MHGLRSLEGTTGDVVRHQCVEVEPRELGEDVDRHAVSLECTKRFFDRGNQVLLRVQIADRAEASRPFGDRALPIIGRNPHDAGIERVIRAKDGPGEDRKPWVVVTRPVQQVVLEFEPGLMVQPRMLRSRDRIVERVGLSEAGLVVPTPHWRQAADQVASVVVVPPVRVVADPSRFSRKIGRLLPPKLLCSGRLGLSARELHFPKNSKKLFNICAG